MELKIKLFNKVKVTYPYFAVDDGMQIYLITGPSKGIPLDFNSPEQEVNESLLTKLPNGSMIEIVDNN